MLVSGLLYNIAVDFYPKPFLYDLKWVFYLVAGAMLPSILNKNSRAMRVGWILFMLLLSSAMDIVYVEIFDCCHELPTFLDIPPLFEILPTFILILGAQAFTPIISWSIISIQLLNCINTLALNQIFLSALSFGILMLNRFRVPKSVQLFAFKACFLGVPIMLILYGGFLSEFKADGVSTRTVQLQNLEMNLSEKGFGLFGMGYGATYREYIPTPEGDITAVGKSVTGDQESNI